MKWLETWWIVPAFFVIVAPAAIGDLLACNQPSVRLSSGPPKGDGSDLCARAMVAAAACGCSWALLDSGTLNCERDQAQGHAAQLSPECLVFSAGHCADLKACPGAAEGCP
jgi:hypothetical protein